MASDGLCNGTGFDKVVFQTEFYQLPAPIIEVTEFSTRVILFAAKEFRDMDRDDKLRACYLHACLKYVNRENMTNKSLRGRFGIDDKNSAMVSRIIKDTISAGLIRRENADDSKKYSRYIPFWV
jgi:predicted HTH transcriptional regulator